MTKESGYIYLLQREVEFGTDNYKIGRARDVMQRLKGEASYRNCVLYMTMRVNDMVAAESDIKTLFRERYPYNEDGRAHGDEDFTGNITGMMKDVVDICMKYKIDAPCNDDVKTDQNEVAHLSLLVEEGAHEYYLFRKGSEMYLSDNMAKEDRTAVESLYAYMDINKLLSCITDNAYENGYVFRRGTEICYTVELLNEVISEHDKTWWGSVFNIPPENILCDVDVFNKNTREFISQLFAAVYEGKEEKCKHKLILRPINKTMNRLPIISQQSLFYILIGNIPKEVKKDMMRRIIYKSD